jgi:hypothetical protein
MLKQTMQFEFHALVNPQPDSLAAFFHADRIIDATGTALIIKVFVIPEYKAMLEAMIARIQASEVSSYAVFAAINGCEIMRRIRADENKHPITPA